VPLRFNQKKATQAASRFLRLADGQMNKIVLIKLLYLIDRKALLRWARPVTGDAYFSMKYGPILSGVLDLVDDVPIPGHEGFWAKHISEPAHHIVKLLADPGTDQLSEAEESLIDEVFKQFGHYAPFELVDILHKLLPEWKEVQEGRVPISYADILHADQKSDAEIEAIQDELEGVSAINPFLAAT
jgi:uncharacterized phage-associated protein